VLFVCVCVCPYFSFEAVEIFTKGGLNFMSLEDTLGLLLFHFIKSKRE